MLRAKRHYRKVDIRSVRWRAYKDLQLGNALYIKPPPSGIYGVPPDYVPPRVAYYPPAPRYYAPQVIYAQPAYVYGPRRPYYVYRPYY